MKKRTIFIPIIAAILFAASTALLTGAGGNYQLNELLLPWMIISISSTHPCFSVVSFAPFVFAAHLAICIGLAWLFGLLIRRRRKENGPNQAPHVTSEPALGAASSTHEG